MDIVQIRYFIRICEAGSIAKAAEQLHLSQQGLSLSIRRLERELQYVLFSRKSTGVELTEEGKLFYSEATEILKHVDRIYGISNKTDKSGKYIIKCSVADSLIVRLPTRLQRLLISGNDEYSILLLEGYSSECVARLDNNESVFAIVYGDWDMSKYDVTRLDRVKQVWIVNREHPWAERDSISLADLDGVPICVSDERSKPRQELDQMFADFGVKMNVAYVCNRPRVTVDLVSNNPSLIARTIAGEVTERDLEKIKVLELDDVPFETTVSIVSKKDHKLSIQERYFKHLVLDAYSNG